MSAGDCRISLQIGLLLVSSDLNEAPLTSSLATWVMGEWTSTMSDYHD